MDNYYKVYLSGKHPCEVCGRVFFEKCEMRRHMESHGADKTYIW